MNKFLKFLLNGGSAIIYTIIGVNFFIFNMSFGMSIIEYSYFTAYMAVFYLLIQGIQFNMANVNSFKDAAIDMLMSVIPFIFMLYVFFTIDIPSGSGELEIAQNNLKVFVRNIMFVTILIDIFVFGWGSLKLLLYTDKNAHSQA